MAMVLDPPPSRGSRLAAAAGFLIALPLLLHAAFSWMGWNPTDDGFVLAYSRRLLDGQIPHRDFISIRPVGSALLHAPWVWLGGEHTFWIGRLAAWLELAFIAWSWTRIAARIAGESSRSRSLLVAWIALVAGSFTFPPMPWHTVDALALVSGGLWLALSPAGTKQALGYALLGAAALCRQNFLPLAPLAALALGHRRRAEAGVAILPLALYGGWLVANEALGPALEQLAAQADLLQMGVRAYTNSVWAAAGFAYGGLAGHLLARRRGAEMRRAPAFLGAALTWGLVGAVVCAILDPSAYLHRATFGLFGGSIGVTVAFGLHTGGRHPVVRLGLLALLCAWCASISIGMNSPALAAGALVTHLLTAAHVPSPAPRRARQALGIALAAGGLLVWTTGRLGIVYRDGTVAELTRPLDGVLPGGRGLRTNPRTWELMRDLHHAREIAGAEDVAIVADFPGVWVKAARPNPLPIDWPQATELGTEPLRARTLAAVEALRGHAPIVVQKIAAGPVADRLDASARGGDYFVSDYVREHFRRVGGTRWFDVYR